MPETHLELPFVMHHRLEMGKKSMLWHYPKSEMIPYTQIVMEGSASAAIPQPVPSIQTRTRTPVIDVQMDVVPKVSLNLGQTSVQGRDQ